MLRHGTALCFAAFILGWPACAGSDTDTFWSTPSAAVLASTTVAPAVEPASQQPARTAPPTAVPTPQQTNTAADIGYTGQTESLPQDDRRAEVPEQTASLDPIEPQVEPTTPAPPDRHAEVPEQAASLDPVEPQVKPVTPPPPDRRAEVPEQTASLDPVEPQVKPVTPAPPDRHAEIPGQTASLDPVEPQVKPITPAPPVAEPFGLAATPVSFGQILTKWSGVEAGIRADNGILARCGTDAQHCPKAAQNFLAIVAQGRAHTGLARIGVVNRAVNMAIEPMSDMAQWGVPDRWSDPLETFTTGRGDCEDYAIAKYVALTAAGVPAEDVKLVVVRNTAANEDHAVVAVRNDGNWIILDNRWLMLVKDTEMPKVVPMFVLDDAGVREFVPSVLTVARRTPAPASVGF